MVSSTSRSHSGSWWPVPACRRLAASPSGRFERRASRQRSSSPRPANRGWARPLVEEGVESDLVETVGAGLVRLGACGACRRVVDARRGADEHEALDQIRSAQRQVETHPPAHRVAEVGGVPADLAEETGRLPEVGAVVAGAAVAREVGADDPVVSGQVLADRSPAVPGLGEAVDHHESGSVSVGPGVQRWSVGHRWRHGTGLATRQRGAAPRVALGARGTDRCGEPSPRRSSTGWSPQAWPTPSSAPARASTPLALAVEADERVRVHMHLDERSGSFLAVGLGRATGRPALVVTTSGTAAVELHPAVVEAWYDAIPLVACTADRPPNFQGVGAPQAIDQRELYGRHVRRYVDAGVPGGDGEVARARSLAWTVAGAATGPPAGPVQLDLPFREPLVGEPAEEREAEAARPGGPEGTADGRRGPRRPRPVARPAGGGPGCRRRRRRDPRSRTRPRARRPARMARARRSRSGCRVEHPNVVAHFDDRSGPTPCGALDPRSCSASAACRLKVLDAVAR
ncbi:MAG: thiamine pyrophosphate-binding protein [Acidimicrobiia bacterium]|nr:thiamine pyrophosphate-binding protein [Acidimicrobiia bacterium]